MTSWQTTTMMLALATTAAALWWALRPIRETRRLTARIAAAGIPLLAVGLYMSLGTPKAVIAAAQPLAHRQAPEDLQGMVERLRVRLESEPQNVEGWFMLGRSYQVLEQWESAERALRQAIALAPSEPTLLTDLADVLALMAQGELEGEPRALLEQALQVQPDHPKALLLLAAADFRQGHLTQARARWQMVLSAADVDSPAGTVARQSLERLDAIAGTTDAPPDTPRQTKKRPHAAGQQPSEE